MFEWRDLEGRGGEGELGVIERFMALVWIALQRGGDENEELKGVNMPFTVT